MKSNNSLKAGVKGSNQSKKVCQTNTITPVPVCVLPPALTTGVSAKKRQLQVASASAPKRVKRSRNRNHGSLQPVSNARRQASLVGPSEVEAIIKISPHSVALSMDHVLENIFRFLNRNDLLSCRLQCHQWNSAATARLQKYPLKLQFDKSYATKSGKTMQDFTQLLEYSDGMRIVSPFPCTSYSVTTFNNTSSNNSGSCMRDGILLNILSHSRVVIHSLSLELRGQQETGETQVMDMLYGLLQAQSSNLRSLNLAIYSEIKVSWKVGHLQRSRDSPLLPTDPEFQDIQSKYNFATSKMMTRLKTVEIFGGSAKLLEMIAQLAPKLEEIYIPSAQYEYLLKPINRLRLLQKFDLKPNSSTQLETYESIATVCKEDYMKPQLMEYSFVSKIVVCGSQFEIINAASRVEKVVKRILQCCWDSLKVIRCDLNCLDGFTGPIVLPKVNYLELHILNDSKGTNTFPRDFSLSQTFPNLFTINLYDRQDVKDMDIFVNCLKHEPVRSVCCIWLNCDFNQRIPQNQLLKLQTLFPEAQFS